jgi:Pyruvate/2-oxoacid:ferredoxin oxidoreductase gamma subunit
MTGGQYSSTTPAAAEIGSGFLNQLERPLDICQVAQSAGAPYVDRCSAFDKDLVDKIQRAIKFEGFAVIDIWGICPGRYTKKNRLTAKLIDEALSQLPRQAGIVSENVRPEYSQHYRKISRIQKSASPPLQIDITCQSVTPERQEVVLLGSAGQRIITAGEILCMAGLSAGLYSTQKNEYNVTVLRGPSVSELILSPAEIDFTGIDKPTAVVALSQEGVERRKALLANLDKGTTVICIEGIQLPSTNARIHQIDPKSWGIKKNDWALASLAVLAKLNLIVSQDMLKSALTVKFSGKSLKAALLLFEQTKI